MVSQRELSTILLGLIDSARADLKKGEEVVLRILIGPTGTSKWETQEVRTLELIIPDATKPKRFIDETARMIAGQPYRFRFEAICRAKKEKR